MIRAVALGALATVITGLAAMAAVALVQLRIDLPPEGPACDYEVEDASGGSPGGVERIGVVRLLAGVGAGSLAGAAVILRVARRRPSPLVSGVGSPD